jgi:hypothetical protein
VGTENEPGIDYDALEKLAKAATPGPWFSVENDLVGGKSVTAVDLPMSKIDFRIYRIIADLAWPTDSDFIAAANPATLLALVRKARQRDEAEREIEARVASVPPRTPKEFAIGDCCADAVEDERAAILDALRREK